ncbi:AAA family ATPase [Natrinema thermotolerans]|uniref:AAA family ATPase n=1 Tax=Natrinema thermotolerans TaxID=121872 RepID=A0AAF0PC39_9EURY|nr:AAA family ATPase [Natrinema thermotolerans]WPH65875.1 AAA family ATPase [Haloarchaeal virus HJTV-4]QCC60779.1 AAA family ATPase [Natrinema thermotolerans]QCC61658.1 AAA family ATPase [Natrinema thermotolerans]WMT07825.1 AAA family ATPase [Natrinema thermotolerans]WMT08457.1 AAA family ATPase [Natrinema thermotolerans]
MISRTDVFEDSWPPTELPNRNDELEHLSRRLGPTTRGLEGDDVLIYGGSGVGKTATTRHFLSRKLPDYADVAWAQISCGDKTRNILLKEAAAEHPDDVTVQLNWRPSRLKAALERVVDGEPYILVLDEADSIADHEILADLADVEGVSVIVIAHDRTEWLGHLNNAVIGSFGIDSTIRFNPYSTDELVEILEPRIRLGLDYDAFSRDQLKRIAKETEGVARYGIKAVWAAAEIAKERGHDTVTDADVDDCFDRAMAKMRESNLASLSYTHRALYELVRRLGPTVYNSKLKSIWRAHREEIYADRHREPVTWRHARNYLEKLEKYDLLVRKGRTQNRRCVVTDPDLEATVDLDFVFLAA